MGERCLGTFLVDDRADSVIAGSSKRDLVLFLQMCVSNSVHTHRLVLRFFLIEVPRDLPKIQHLSKMLRRLEQAFFGSHQTVPGSVFDDHFWKSTVVVGGGGVQPFGIIAVCS